MSFPRNPLFFTIWFAAAGLACGGQRSDPVADAAGDAAVATDPGVQKTESGRRVALLESRPEDEPNVGDWPQWRGVRRDGLSDETGLLKEWPEEGPPLVWTHEELGMGFGGPAIVGDRIYILGTEADQTCAFALDRQTGRRVWKQRLAQVYRNNWGDGPRSTPTVDEDRLYVLTGRGTLACLNLDDGAVLWTKRLTDDFGGSIQSWGYCESPLVDGDRVVVTPGGRNCMVALDKLTGDTVWTSSGVQDNAQYASAVVAEVDGVRMFVTMTTGGLIGVDAENGEFLWRYDGTQNGTAICPTPIVAGDLVYSTSGYGAGCGLVRLSVDSGSVDAEEIYHNTVMKNHHGGVLLLDGHVFGYSDGPGWVCQDLTSGDLIWRSKRLGKGSVGYADQRLYCYSENDGTVVLAEVSTDDWIEHGRFNIPRQTQLDRKSGKIWTHPVIAGGKLYLRDQELLFQYDVSDKSD